MDHYIEIKVLPDMEFSASMLINALYAKLHRVLVDVGEGQIGVSFPNSGQHLGDQLRLHGASLALRHLIKLPWLQGLRDFCQCSVVTKAPDSGQWCRAKRRHVKLSAAKLRRLVHRGSLSIEAAKTLLTRGKPVELPFVQLQSNHNCQRFKLFIEQTQVSSPCADGRFSNYGLSNTRTVPWF